MCLPDPTPSSGPGYYASLLASEGPAAARASSAATAAGVLAMDQIDSDLSRIYRIPGGR